MKKLFKVALVLVTALTLFVGCGGSSKVIEPKDGLAEGNIGDTFRSYWFDFSVDSIKGVDEYDGYTAAEGNRIVEVAITIKSTVSYEIPIYSNDFYIVWPEGWVDPIDAEVHGVYDEVDSLGAKEKKTYLWYFEIPEDNEQFLVAFDEVFATDVEADKYGDEFSIYFTSAEIK